MALYEITDTNEGYDVVRVEEKSFDSEEIAEKDIQNMLKSKIDIIAPNILIISEEFSGWSGSRRRIDLLGIDEDANLVVFELKRTESGDHMELQAIRYASMISNMTFSECVLIYQDYLDSQKIDKDATTALLEFLDWETPLEEEFALDVKIILISANFSTELTTSVLWLLNKGLDIQCVRLVLYKVGNKKVLDVDPIIPLPEAEEYNIGVKAKNVARTQAIRSNRDYSKYLFNGEEFGKGRLAQAIVKYYLKDNTQKTYAEIEERFPVTVQGSLGVIAEYNHVLNTFKGKRPRHFINDEDIMVSADMIEFVVCSQWSLSNIENIIKIAQEEGYTVTAV